ncbi:hypothetical protein KC19_7G168600 [Ceratodon purpureus]|uniref:Uncharacterized protein n=1 Tax=Ceratodon purpureus TaxID=3225 RepID=A0A8T0HC42_CERPU|nr:hypothetical protein KC19_7G168600 [Ceratodon purpureus]
MNRWQPTQMYIIVFMYVGCLEGLAENSMLTSSTSTCYARKMEAWPFKFNQHWQFSLYHLGRKLIYSFAGCFTTLIHVHWWFYFLEWMDWTWMLFTMCALCRMVRLSVCTYWFSI